MKRKKIVMYSIVVFFILLIIGIGYLIYINVNYNKNQIDISEYTPEQEITDDQLRNTVISLYFLNKETNVLEEERRQTDSKILLENPYKYLIELLIQGPENQDLVKIIPEGTKIVDAKINNGIVSLKFSEKFSNNEETIINSIEKTLKQLNEVVSIEILNNQ